MRQPDPIFGVFLSAMLRSRDACPFAPVLRALNQSLPEEQALWRSFLFLAFDHLGSAWQAWSRVPQPGLLPPDLAKLPMYQDRRGLRGGHILRHVASYVRQVRVAGSQRAWLQAGWGSDPIANYHCLWTQSHRVWGNGRWATFKWAELLKHVHGWCLAAPDMRLAGASGPKQGLAILYGEPLTRSQHYFEQLGMQLMAAVHQWGLTPDWEALEKVLCNWHSLAHGRYYVGYDIDAMHDEIGTIPDGQAQAKVFAARAQALPAAYLGEVGGWGGIDHDRLRAYQATGLVALREGSPTAQHTSVGVA